MRAEKISEKLSLVPFLADSFREKMCANKTGKNFNLGKSGSGGSRFYYRHNKSEQYFGQYVSPISFSSNLVSLGFILFA